MASPALLQVFVLLMIERQLAKNLFGKGLVDVVFCCRDRLIV